MRSAPHCARSAFDHLDHPSAGMQTLYHSLHIHQTRNRSGQQLSDQQQQDGFTRSQLTEVKGYLKHALSKSHSVGEKTK